MATTTNPTVRFARLSLGIMLAWAAFLLPVDFARAQSDAGLMRARALRQGIDLYKAKDYEKAAEFFVYAQDGQQSLSPSDQKDLMEFSAQNGLALKARQDGVAQLRQADEAVKQGRNQEATNLLTVLGSNQYLTPEERQKVGELSQLAQAKATPQGKTDVKTLLSNGRAALQAGDLAGAESYANQADKASSLLPSLLQPWNDSPAKLRRDIQAAKLKAQPPAPNETMPKNPEAGEPKSASGSKFLGMSLWPFGGSSNAAKKDDMSPESEAKFARHLVKDGFFFLEQAGEIDKARMCALEAKKINVNWGPNEQTPDMLLHEIQRRIAGVSRPGEQPSLPPVDTPLPANADPRTMLKQGRALLAAKKYEEADKLCSQVTAANVKWGLFEDTPEKLRKDIVRSRQVWERDESVRLMAEARQDFSKGNIDDAEKKAFKAQRYHGPYGVFDFGDRPQKLLDEIQKTRKTNGLPSPVDRAVAGGPKDQPNVRPDRAADLPAVPAGMMNANKNRAIVMVREARELERQNLLLDARQKAFEARAMNAVFGPDEDSPDNVLLSLAARCDRQISTHLNKAIECVGSLNDEQRFQKAQEQLLAAHKLAHTFQLDLTRIQQTAAQLNQVATGSRAINTVGNFQVQQQGPTLTGDPQKDAMRKAAWERLQYAQVELTYGKTVQARKMAMELYRPEYGIQEEVAKLLRSISAEEYNQQLIEAKRTFDAGVDAFLAKKYNTAMEIFRTVDPLMLPEQYQARIRDIMSTKEMQPHNVEQAGGFKFLKKTPIDPTTQPEGPAAELSLMDKVKAEQAVRFQAMRQRGQEALRTATDLYKNDQKDQAIDTLKTYINQVAMENFEDQKAKDLMRLPEARVQQFRTMINEEKLRGIQIGSQFAMKWDEPANQAKIKARQEEMVQKMKLVGELMKQNKLDEAEVEVRKVREIDPNNLAAAAALNIIITKREQQRVDQEINEKEGFFKDQLRAGPGPSLDMGNPIAFDKNRTGRKQDSGAIPHNHLDPKERAIDYRLRQPISFKFKDLPLESAIAELENLSGVSIVPDRKALQNAHVNLNSPLTFSSQNLDMKSALNLMLRDIDLTYTIENQSLVITTPENTKGRLVRVTYPVADLITVVPDHPMPDVLNIVKALENSMKPPPWAYGGGGYVGQSPFGYGEPVSTHTGSGLGSTYGSRGQNAANQSGNAGGSAPKDRSKDAMAEVLKQLVQDTIHPNTWASLGGTGNIQYFPFGMALVINQTLEVQEEVALLLATLRKLQDLQVSVELRAVVVSETFFERIGVDFDMNIKAPKRAGTNALLAGDIATASQKGAISGLTGAGTLTPDLGFPIRNSTFNFTTPAFGGYQPEAGLSLGLAFLSDIQVFMFLEAVQGDRRAHIMQAPKITVFNGQQANISGIVSRPVVTTVIPAALPDGNMTMTPITTQLPFGLGLQVQPVVSPDRRFIRLNITPTLTQFIVDPAGATVTAVPGQGNNPPLANGPLIVQTQIQPGATSLIIANTTVNVPDGGTVLLGGFKFLAEERTEYGPPVLSKIPYISRLFRNVGWSRDGATLIFLVTARVIMVEEEERIFLGLEPPIPGR